jgi:hypothetical protein
MSRLQPWWMPEAGTQGRILEDDSLETRNKTSMNVGAFNLFSTTQLSRRVWSSRMCTIRGEGFYTMHVLKPGGNRGG